MPETTPALTDWWDPWDVYQALVRAAGRLKIHAIRKGKGEA
jgi:hypothetical protein